MSVAQLFALFCVLLMPARGQGLRQRLGFGVKRISPFAAKLGSIYKQCRMKPKEMLGLASAASSSGANDGPRGLVGRLARRASVVEGRKRQRTNRTCIEDRHASRDVGSAVKKTATRTLGPVYHADLKMWDIKADKQCTRKVSFLPIHETMNEVIQPGDEGRWTSFDDSQKGFEEDLKSWATRLAVDLSAFAWLCIGLWGDSAPYSHKDSVFLLLWHVLNGSDRTICWFCSFTKRHICRCGCLGRCTFNGVFEVAAWTLKACLAGKFPMLDHKNQPFKEGSWRS